MALIAVPEPISCWRSDELGGPGAVTVEIDLSHLVERATDLLTSGCSYLDLGVERADAERMVDRIVAAYAERL